MTRVESLEHRWSQEQLITGIELPDWLRLLKKNGWSVDRSYLHRAAWITSLSIPTAFLGKLDDALYQLRQLEIG